MKKTLLFAFLLSLFMQAAIAVPAKPGPIKITQGDGSPLTIRLYGDEFFSYTTTNDGYQIRQASDGNYYYFTPSSATRAAVQIQAHEPAMRTAAERAFLSTITVGGDLSYIAQGQMNAMARRAELGSAIAASKGSSDTRANALAPKGLVIVVQYADIKMQPGRTIGDFTVLLNQEGYSLNGGTGSSRDFYNESSMGKYNPEFVVCPQIITLPQPRAFYGANDANGNDINPRQMILDACIGADQYINFADFDTDGDGYVDNVFVYYAGNNEAEGGAAESIWPHRWVAANNKGAAPAFDGVKVWDYACTSELRGKEGINTLAGIGTFTHEFGHVLGLPDFYDTDYTGSGGNSPGLYYISTMSSGSYHNDGCTPPYFTALERWLLGWNKLTPLKEGALTIKPINIENDAWMIPTQDEDEIYIIEARNNAEHWDKYIGSPGLLIYHIDRSAAHIRGGISAKQRWSNNSINNVPEQECAKLIESGGFMPNLASELFYPGSKNVTQFTSKSYGGKDNGGFPIKFGLSDISWDGSQISLTVMRGGSTSPYVGIADIKSTYTTGSSFTPKAINLAETPTNVEWIIDGAAAEQDIPYVFQKAGKVRVVCKITYVDTSVETITRTVTVL